MDLGGIIWSLIIGLIAGAIAKLLMPGKDPGGFVITMLLGVAGSFLGTFLWSLLFQGDTDSQAGHLIAGIIGALILLAIYRMVARRNDTPVV
ncbi:MAG: GlsB/YeaQ/YmgE family stress response membrane protein [Bacteroidota bacterium]